MKKVKLTSAEEEKIKQVNEVVRKRHLLDREYEMLMAEFWYNFTARVGSGSFVYESTEGAIFEKSFEERRAENNKK